MLTSHAWHHARSSHHAWAPHHARPTHSWTSHHAWAACDHQQQRTVNKHPLRVQFAPNTATDGSSSCYTGLMLLHAAMSSMPASASTARAARTHAERRTIAGHIPRHVGPGKAAVLRGREARHRVLLLLVCCSTTESSQPGTHSHK
jgi:hypothetical protein